jgi:hypothetical protein
MDLLQDLLDIIQQSSLSRLKSLSKRDDVDLLAMDENPLVCAHWMSLILLSGPQLRVTFKTHFMLEAAQTFACKAYQMESREVSQLRGKDFFREFCNLTAGHAKLVLAANDVRVGVSLPALARGFDDIFYPRDKLSAVRHWKLVCNEASVICSVHFDIFGSVAIRKMNIDQDQAVGDVELL